MKSHLTCQCPWFPVMYMYIVHVHSTLKLDFLKHTLTYIETEKEVLYTFFNKHT